jgi:hypothetical protein
MSIFYPQAKKRGFTPMINPDQGIKEDTFLIDDDDLKNRMKGTI